MIQPEVTKNMISPRLLELANVVALCHEGQFLEIGRWVLGDKTIRLPTMSKEGMDGSSDRPGLLLHHQQSHDILHYDSDGRISRLSSMRSYTRNTIRKIAVNMMNELSYRYDSNIILLAKVICNILYYITIDNIANRYRLFVVYVLWHRTAAYRGFPNGS
jgi:hypothetical protein